MARTDHAAADRLASPAAGDGPTAVRAAAADRVASRAAIRDRLAAAGVPTPEVDARLLAAAAADGRVTDLESAVQRRCRREPLQHILGSVGFRYLELTVAPGVFIPRPETEVLAGLAIDACPPGGLVVEPCTGTGAVALAVASETDAQVWASDLDPAAVALARSNAARLGLDLTITQADLAAAVPSAVHGRVDVLVCNPPYLAAHELDGLEPEVRCGDPTAALVAGPTGHEASDRLLALAGSALAPGGTLLLEVDTARAAATAQRAQRLGLDEVAVHADLTGADRIVTARRRPADA